jgi:hypothetical protein
MRITFVIKVNDADIKNKDAVKIFAQSFGSLNFWRTISVPETSR